LDLAVSLGVKQQSTIDEDLEVIGQ
jgi:hypothetical protein